ncbi:HlyD family efflux transporter periplasmic adaptor subunit [Pseudovibrio exalbescens]|uniref:HlyD family secretion protein n=1 Tax=Pseudovibrio exalbescens TaxID=197461 RepID=UPI0023654023|nr:HlyD family efflux transporter periplasmic adaptor subunit [Pseudovibrio exalbescens]MDD7911424.1 HlyD family efflux transporter periplasmic adaptor subunit [Pseudovibrio exalbescens]
MIDLCVIPVLAGLLGSCGADAVVIPGYVEGEYTHIAANEQAEILELAVKRGERIGAEQVIARLETEDAEIALSEAEASLATAKAELEDLLIGKRPEEISVIEATLRSAEAQAKEAKRVMKRLEGLHARAVASQAQLDEASTAHDMAIARVAELEANLAVAQLPARASVIEAAEKKLEQAQTRVERAQWLLDKRVIRAQQDGEVSDVIRRVGEMAGPGAPIVSVLPDGATKLTLYVPEAAFSAVDMGDKLSVACSGCPSGLEAIVTYISAEPEFTPPVIFSVDTRDKLVYLVEARPTSGSEQLKPGQIVDVTLD